MYCHTNNLAVVQEAAVGCARDAWVAMNGVELWNGDTKCLIIWPYAGQPNYEVYTTEDWESWEFPDFAGAMDFAATLLR